MSDYDHSDDITVTIATESVSDTNDSETSSSKSHLSINATSEIDGSSFSKDIKKGVHFKETVEIFLIPSRKELLAATVLVCHENGIMMTVSKATDLETNRMESISPFKRASFLQFIEMIKIPSSKQLSNETE